MSWLASSLVLFFLVSFGESRSRFLHREGFSIRDEVAPQIYSVEKRVEPFTVSGDIHFAGIPPANLTNSELKVFLEDISIWDTNSRRLKETTVDLTDYKLGKKLKYSMSLEPKPKPHDSYNIAAVLNVGWIPQGSGPSKSWIKKGDYNTNRMFVFAILKTKNKYTKNIELEKIPW